MAGLPWTTWMLLAASVGAGFLVQLLFRIAYERRLAKGWIDPVGKARDTPR